MGFKKVLSLLSAGVLLAALALAGCSSGSNDQGSTSKATSMKKLQLGTGSVGGTYFGLGGEIATVLSDNVDVPGFSVSAVETGASVENIVKVSQGKLQLGLAGTPTAVQALQGKGEFDGKKLDNFGYMGYIYPDILHIVTLGSSGINSVTDLKGKSVAIGPPGSATQDMSKTVLKAYGIKDDDYKMVQEDFGIASTKLQDGNIDASFAGLGVPASGVNELQATKKNVKLLSLSSKVVKKITDTTGYGDGPIAADAYSWLDKPVHSISLLSGLFGSTTQISKDLGYKITKALYEHADEVTNPQGKTIRIKDALTGAEGLPLHPGAKKYFLEKGLSVKE